MCFAACVIRRFGATFGNDGRCISSLRPSSCRHFWKGANQGTNPSRNNHLSKKTGNKTIFLKSSLLWPKRMFRSTQRQSTTWLVIVAMWAVAVVVGRAYAFHVLNANTPKRASAATTTNGVAALLDRRAFLSTTAAILSSSSLIGTSPCMAFPFGDDVGKDRIQKELCIVNLLRLKYWAQATATKLELSEDPDQRQKAYLEARLGAKAIVAKKRKIGGGATPRVFTLLSLQITECLDDLKFYAKNNKRVVQLQEDLIDALASIVEFDGLETTLDPSPRSSLTLGQYNDGKALYVRRMLSERVTPLAEELVDYFGPDTRAQCEGYMRDYYPSELPPPPSTANESGSIEATGSTIAQSTS